MSDLPFDQRLFDKAHAMATEHLERGCFESRGSYVGRVVLLRGAIYNALVAAGVDARRVSSGSITARKRSSIDVEGLVAKDANLGSITSGSGWR